MGDGVATTSPRRSRRRLVVAFVLLILLLAIAWLATPWFLQGYARGIIVESTESFTGASVELGAVELSWGGPQVIRNLRAVREDGMVLMDVDASVKASFWDFLGTPKSPYVVTCSGLVHLAPGLPEAAPETPREGLPLPVPVQAEPPGEADLGQLPPIRLEVGPMVLDTTDEQGRKRQFSTSNLVVECVPSTGALAAHGDVEQRAGDVHGAIRIDADVRNLLDVDGRLQLERAAGDVHVTATLPELPIERIRGLQRFSLKGSCPSPGAQAEVVLGGDFEAVQGPPHQFALRLVRDGDDSDHPGRLAVSAAEFPMAMLDAVARFDGDLEAVLGNALDLDVVRQVREDSRQEWNVKMTSPDSTFNAAVSSRGDHLWLAENHSITGQLRITPECIATVLWRLGPGLQDLHSVQDPVHMTIQQLSVDLDGSVSSLDAEAEIEVGTVTIDARSGAFSVIDSVLGRVKKSVPAIIEPIRLKVVDGVLIYDPFKIHFEHAEVVLAGLVDLNDGRLDMSMQVPVGALGLSSKELQMISGAIQAEVLITGTVEKPIVTLAPSFNPEGLLKLPGLGDLLEGVGQKHEPLLRGIGDLLKGGGGKP